MNDVDGTGLAAGEGVARGLKHTHYTHTIRLRGPVPARGSQRCGTTMWLHFGTLGPKSGSVGVCRRETHSTKPSRFPTVRHDGGL